MEGGGELRPNDRSGLILRVALPAGLEALRSRHVPNAADGVPAHVTLLVPFAEPDQVDDAMRAEIGAICRGVPAFSMTLVERRAWPGTLYVAVEPEPQIRELQAVLAAGFPTLPLYGGAFPFIPHVTVAVEAAAGDQSVIDDPAWDALPMTSVVDGVELIVPDPAGRCVTGGWWPLGPRT